jgi:hypothetical protein
MTFVHAASIFHRFYNNIKICDYDKFAIATGSISLATKVNEEPVRMKDIINVSQVTLNREECLNEMANTSWILSIRDTIVQCEMFIMRVLNFSANTELPHPYLLNYISTVENWLPNTIISQIPIAQCCMSLLHDFYFNSNVVTYHPEEIAISILALTFQLYGLKIALVEDADNWFKIFNPSIQSELVWEIIEEVLKAYDD